MRRPAVGALVATSVLASLALAWARVPRTPPQVTLSIVGTTDLHGRIKPDEYARGGLAVFGGFLDNLRAARAADQGAVLLLDAGDTFQATTTTMRGLDSNLSEGAVVVDAYNALGYTALAIGNHDFEFGAVDGAAPGADPRGALKAAAARARFPFLAANTIDAATKEPVDWPNVRPSVIVEAAGIRVGLVGVMTFDALTMTLAANVGGLATAPLAATVDREARQLRQQGADIVVLVAHAGGWCDDLSNPLDVSSCGADSEIFEVVRALPRGTLQAIVAGHTHVAMAHVFDGVPITSVPEGGILFGRTDLTVDTATRRVIGLKVHPPQRICAREDATDGECQAPDRGTVPSYEGRPVQSSAAVTAALAPAIARVERRRAQPLGVVVAAPIERGGPGESALGNLFADAVRESLPGTDVAISYGGGRGGLREGLPAGLLTFGALYDAFPFDNRVVRAALNGEQLVQALEAQLTSRRRGLVSLSGVRGTVRCAGARPRVTLVRDSGEPVQASDLLTVVSTAYSAQSAVWAPVTGDEGVMMSTDAPLFREVVEQWLRSRGGRIAPQEFYDAAAPRWRLTGPGRQAPGSGPVCDERPAP